MKFSELIKGELKGWGKYERILFPLTIAFIIAISFYLNDSKIALVSAVCGISYTILAGKGKISCYFFGLAGTLCYVYIAYKNLLYGNMLLYLLYYFPMQVVGIFQWKKYLKKYDREIIKTSLNFRERTIYFSAAIVVSLITALILKQTGDTTPVIDAVTTVFSVAGLLLTIKRCIEQWYIWMVVNGLSVIMWANAYIHGSNCFATILMWTVYFVLSFYFLYTWNQAIKIKKDTTKGILF